MGFFDNMMNRPITTRQWQYFEIIGDIDSDANSITFGLILSGAGKVWIDNASFEIVGDAAPQVTESAKPMMSQELGNLIAFSKLYGYVRYFHPSDEAFKTDWDKFAVDGVRKIENANNDKELIQKLNEIFKPVAPSLIISSNKIHFINEDIPPGATKVLFWKHQGYGFGLNHYIYKSERMSANIVNKQIPAAAPKSWSEKIDKDVFVHVPVSVFADEQGTLPHSTNIQKLANQPTSIKYEAEDRATRIADVIIAWNIFQHFYPYFEETRVDWNPVLPQILREAVTDKDAAEFKDTLSKLVARLNDGHGAVQSANQPLGFPPVKLSWIENKAVVTAIENKDSPVKIGDVVTALDGQPIEKIIRDKEQLVSAATEQYRKYRVLQEILIGQPDSQIQLEVLRDGQLVQATLKREMRPVILKESRPKKTFEIEPGLFYVNLDEATDADFNAFLPKLEQAKGIVFDLRGYPRMQNPFEFFSHLTRQKLTSPKLMVPINTEPNQTQVQFNDDTKWEIAPKEPYLGAKKVFITNSAAISQSETWLGLVEDYKLGEILGEPTAGTNGDVNPFILPGGYLISWTGLKVRKHDGSPHHGVGILPTILVKPTVDGIRTGRDELLEKAVEYLKNN